MSRERAGHTLQTTAILNEAYLRLVDNYQAALAEPDPLAVAVGVALVGAVVQPTATCARHLP